MGPHTRTQPGSTLCTPSKVCGVRVVTPVGQRGASAHAWDDRKCLCAHPERCAAICNRFHRLGDRRGNHYTVPHKDVGATTTAGKRRHSQYAGVERHLKCKKRVKPKAPGKKNFNCVAWWHHAPKALALVPPAGKRGNPNPLNTKVPAAVAKIIGEMSGISYTDADRDPDDPNSYLMVPNYSMERAERDLQILEKAAFKLSTTPQDPASPLAPSPFGRDPAYRSYLKLCTDSPHSAAEKLCALETQIDEFKKSIDDNVMVHAQLQMRLKEYEESDAGNKAAKFEHNLMEAGYMLYEFITVAKSFSII